MHIEKTTRYKQDLKRKIINRHLDKEYETILKIEDLILSVNNMQELINHPFRIIYNIKKKNGNLKDIYTARINGKTRLYIKPIGSYPYVLDNIIKIEFQEINDKHYKE